MLWRERPQRHRRLAARAQWVFYGAVALLVVDLGWFFLDRSSTGLDALAFFLVLGAGGYAMFRIWRDQHRYS